MELTAYSPPKTEAAATSLNGHAPTVTSNVAGQGFADPAPRPEPKHTDKAAATKANRFGMGLLLSVVAILITVVVVSPIALSSSELVRWAGDTTGLGLTGGWPWLVFISLDAAAGTCVLLAVYCAVKGLSPGVFGLLVWVFAGFSAFANYRHGIAPGAPGDAWWFFPVMSVLGPGLLEAVTRFLRKQVQKRTGKRNEGLPKFGLMRWLPFVGAPLDTYGARRTAQLLGISTVDEAVRTYHTLCPNGSLQVAKAIRDRDVRAAKEAAKAAAATTGRTPRSQSVELTIPSPRAPHKVKVTPTDSKTRRPKDETLLEYRQLKSANPGQTQKWYANELELSERQLLNVRQTDPNYPND